MKELNIFIQEPYTHTYGIYEHKIPISEINQETCRCFEPRNHMLKKFDCKGECKKNRPFFVIDLKESPRADLIDNFSCNVDFTLYFSGKIIKKTSRILSLCSVFHGAYALIYLDQPNMPNEIILSKRFHIFEDQTRRRIIQTMNPDGILDNEFLYKEGMVEIL